MPLAGFGLPLGLVACARARYGRRYHKQVGGMLFAICLVLAGCAFVVILGRQRESRAVMPRQEENELTVHPRAI